MKNLKNIFIIVLIASNAFFIGAYARRHDEARTAGVIAELAQEQAKEAAAQARMAQAEAEQNAQQARAEARIAKRKAEIIKKELETCQTK